MSFPDPYVFYGQLSVYFNPENDILITLRDSKNILKGMTLGRVEGENIDVQVSIIDSDTQKKGYIKPIMDMFEDIARARGLKTMSWIDQTEHYADVSRRVYGDRIYKETKSHGGGATFRVTL